MAQEPRTPSERALLLLRAALLPAWLPTTDAQRLVWAIRIAIVVGVMILISSAYNNSLWEWLELLIIPAVVAAGGLWFSQQQKQRELDIADQRAQDEALQAYLDQMLQLLSDKDRPLHAASSGGSLSKIARARTLTVLPGLGKNRKSRLLQFLVESTLIQGDKKKPPVINLTGADLRGVNLRGADLHGAFLRGAKLDHARLRGADLGRADLARALLSGADLSDAYLTDANLRDTYLVDANLRDAKLVGADLREGHLRNADLTGSDLRNANLRDARLRGADLHEAKVTGANLSRAELRGAKRVTDEELAQQASSQRGHDARRMEARRWPGGGASLHGPQIFAGRRRQEPLWRPCAPRRTPITTTGLPFRIRLAVNGAATVRPVA